MANAKFGLCDFFPEPKVALIKQGPSVLSCSLQDPTKNHQSNQEIYWLTLLLVLVKSPVNLKSRVKQVKWDQLIKTEGNPR